MRTGSHYIFRGCSSATPAGSVKDWNIAASSFRQSSWKIFIPGSTNINDINVMLNNQIMINWWTNMKYKNIIKLSRVNKFEDMWKWWHHKNNSSVSFRDYTFHGSILYSLEPSLERDYVNGCTRKPLFISLRNSNSRIWICWLVWAFPHSIFTNIFILFFIANLKILKVIDSRRDGSSYILSSTSLV